jgi:TolB-like protein
MVSEQVSLIIRYSRNTELEIVSLSITNELYQGQVIDRHHVTYDVEVCYVLAAVFERVCDAGEAELLVNAGEALKGL